VIEFVYSPPVLLSAVEFVYSPPVKLIVLTSEDIFRKETVSVEFDPVDSEVDSA